MVNRVLKSDKSKYSVDLWIIALSCAVFYGIMGIFYMLLKFDMGRFPILVQTLIGAVFEFGCGLSGKYTWYVYYHSNMGNLLSADTSFGRTIL